MGVVSIKDLQSRLSEIADRAEGGERIVVTRDGRPVLDIAPHRPPGGLDMAAGRAFLRARGIVDPAPYVAEDFDDPLPEDVLLRPLA